MRITTAEQKKMNNKDNPRSIHEKRNRIELIAKSKVTSFTNLYADLF